MFVLNCIMNYAEILENILKNSGLVEKGLENRLNDEEISQILSTMLFEITNKLGQKLVEVRDYDEIKVKGTFRYSGQTDMMLKEGLIPQDVYDDLDDLKSLGIERHIGPSYLRVKGLLTHRPTRKFFGRQMAFVIRDYLKQNPPTKSDGFVMCIPNMTGGAWIGDETGEQLESVLTDYRVWTATPYVRETRKSIDVINPSEKLVDYVEGLVTPPANTSVIFCFEELRTAAETTQNATKIYRAFGYNEENGVRIVEASVFDYGHPVGVERLKRLGVDRLFLVDGETFFNVSKKNGYISESQYRTGIDWLTEPWAFTRKVLPDVKKLIVK